MCGIAGVFHFGDHVTQVDVDQLTAVRDAMYTRGPDDHGIWVSDDRLVGLAHRRLAILDLSERGKQPMSSADGAVVICYNGEIYNFRELRSDLEARGSTFRTECDTEVLIELYRVYGISCVERLRGMFAFALWDKAARTLYLVRDLFGIKPLYYSEQGGKLLFASQVKALLQFPDISRDLDPAGVCGYFTMGSVPEPHTLFRSIRQLPPGGVVKVSSREGFRVKEGPGLQQFSDAADLTAIDQPTSFGRCLQNSVAAHLISDAPVGFFLSAGLDSSSLVACAVESGHSDIRTVTLGFDRLRGSLADETELAERTAAHYGTRHQTVWISEEDFTSSLDEFFAAMDQPSIDGANSFFVSLASRRAGLKVAISGLGADELLGGYPSFHDIPRCLQLCSLLGDWPRLARSFRTLSAPLLACFTSPKYAGLFEYGSSVMGAYLLRRGLFMPWELPGIVGRELFEEGWPEFSAQLLDDSQLAAWDSLHEKISVAELSWYMRNQLLRDTDWASMAHSLEVRVPFVDREVARSVFQHEGDNPLSKMDMVQSLKRPLPKDIISRPKSGFWVPVREWLEHIDPQRAGARGLRGWAELVYERYLALCLD